MTTADNQQLLRVVGIVKRFPGVVALGGVSFDLNPGEVHVLLGENGAGKSTLIKCLSGVYHPDEGRVVVDGEQARIDTASRAEQLGIATIHQEFNRSEERRVGKERDEAKGDTTQQRQPIG